jgi:hypothetical protein
VDNIGRPVCGRLPEHAHELLCNVSARGAVGAVHDHVDGVIALARATDRVRAASRSIKFGQFALTIEADAG